LSDGSNENGNGETPQNPIKVNNIHKKDYCAGYSEDSNITNNTAHWLAYRSCSIAPFQSNLSPDQEINISMAKKRVIVDPTKGDRVFTGVLSYGDIECSQAGVAVETCGEASLLNNQVIIEATENGQTIQVEISPGPDAIDLCSTTTTTTTPTTTTTTTLPPN